MRIVDLIVCLSTLRGLMTLARGRTPLHLAVTLSTVTTTPCVGENPAVFQPTLAGRSTEPVEWYASVLELNHICSESLREESLTSNAPLPWSQPLFFLSSPSESNGVSVL